jgi:hypothetical protein
MTRTNTERANHELKHVVSKARGVATGRFDTPNRERRVKHQLRACGRRDARLRAKVVDEVQTTFEVVPARSRFELAVQTLLAEIRLERESAA